MPTIGSGAVAQDANRGLGVERIVAVDEDGKRGPGHEHAPVAPLPDGDARAFAEGYSQRRLPATATPHKGRACALG